MKTVAAATEDSMEHPQNTKDRGTTWSSNPIPRYVSGEDKTTNSKRYIHLNVHSSIIYESQDMETPQVIINRCWT